MALYDESATLVRLSDTSLTVQDPAEDVRGYKMVDKDGKEIGEVNELLIDERDKKVRFLEAESGGVLGIGSTQYLLPVDTVTKIVDETVHVNLASEAIADAPRYNPDLVDERYVNDVCGYYGCRPYWGPGYVYPSYPYYPYR